MVIQVTFPTRFEARRSGLATHVRDPARATMSTSLTLNSFLPLPPCQRWTLPKRFSGLHKGSFWNQGDWSIMRVPVIDHVFPKSTLFSLQGEGDTVSEGKTNTGPLSGRWSGSFTSFYIFLALQLQWKFLEIFWSIWFSKSSESMALTADPILVSLCFKEKEIEFRQKEHLSLYSGHISGKHHTSKKRSSIMQFRRVDCQKLWRNQILGQSPHIITIWTRHHWPK